MNVCVHIFLAIEVVHCSAPVCRLLQKIEARVAADEDLKLADLLKYYLRESQAAKVSSASAVLLKCSSSLLQLQASPFHIENVFTKQTAGNSAFVGTVFRGRLIHI